MTAIESNRLIEMITEGVQLAIKRLIERTQKEDGELVISKDGKIVSVKARDIIIDENAAARQAKVV